MTATDRGLGVELTAFDTATLWEAAGQRGALAAGIRALAGSGRVAGPALTVLTQPHDNLALHRAVADARPGEIIVAQCHDCACGVWGEVLTVAAQARGIAALVIDGAVRDLDSIRELGFPVFARTTAIESASKAREGHLRIPIACGGQLIEPGDIVVADLSGIVAVPAANLDAVLTAARTRVEKETHMMEALRGGATTVELLGLGPAAPSGDRGLG
jgi:4-hydroxy-4-methyl-2-oxoglutarate aldolase